MTILFFDIYFSTQSIMKQSLIFIFIVFFLYSCDFTSKNNSVSKTSLVENEVFYPIDSLKNQEIKDKLYKIRSAIESQNWNKFISFCDSTNYYAQTEGIKSNNENYIYEILNIKLESNGNNTKNNFQILSSIFEISFIDYSQSTNSFLFRGTIVTYTKQKIPFSIQLEKDKNTNFRIVGGWG